MLSYQCQSLYKSQQCFIVVTRSLYSPNSWVVGPEPHYEVALRIRHEGIPAHWHGWKFGVVVRVVEPSIGFRSPDDLEIMTM